MVRNCAQLDERAVQAGVGGELGMEAGCHQVAVAHEHRFVVIAREHLDAVTDRLDRAVRG